MSQSVDLTPFEFTGTESLVYGALLRLGPTTGYAVARATRLARANVYSALDGLVTRGAAVRTPGRPARYRPTDPQALIAQLAARHGEALDRLTRSLQDFSRPTEPETRAVEGLRAVANVIQQLVARVEHRVEGVLAADLWRPTLPAWRRAASRATVVLYLAGDETPPGSEGLITGLVAKHSPSVLLIDELHTVAAPSGAQFAAVWSSHPAIAALARAALGSLI